MTNNLAWRTSTYTGGTGGNCVEVAPMATGVAVRDSKNPDGPVLILSKDEWASFITRVRSAA